ncbi:hypothetical protein CRM22_009431 [Opisthorchis felineus]|uniref:Phospholipid scramblase n=1 Tax=Opisthorchis felineus TaxID=147828 RepID=A0A4S2L8X1_OPIFE|nr:hypothetical protein CRM22_009431 [Opisthorchis felineus]
MDASGLPTHLTSLLEADRIIVRQDCIPKSKERCSILNTYEVFANDSNDKWKSILNFEEQSSWKSRMFCCSARPFRMRAWAHDETVLLMRRPYGCPASTDTCLPHRLEVKLPDDTPLGSIVRTFGRCESAFRILDAEDTPRLLLKGSCMASNWCLDFVFKIYSVKGGRSIGRIIREWREECDVFYIAFPRDLHVVLKLLVMSSSVLIVRHEQGLPESLLSSIDWDVCSHALRRCTPPLQIPQSYSTVETLR